MTAPPSFHVEPAHRAALREAGLDTLAGCLAFTGGAEVKAKVPGRDVRRIDVPGATYFVKRVRGPGWREAVREGTLLHRLHSRGLPVAEPAAVGGEKGAGVLVTVALPAATTLERALLDGPVDQDRTCRLAARVGSTLRALHDVGVNHRDFYAGHILLDTADTIYFVDFGRAELRRRVPFSRVVKDVAALRASLPERVFDDRAESVFLDAYLGHGSGRLRRFLLSTALTRKSRRLRRHTERQVARGARNVHVNH